MMASMETNDRDNPALSFLDLEDCPPDERERILTILHGPPPEPPPPPPQQQLLHDKAPAAAAADKPEPVQLQYTASGQQQQPYVYINNVTANVNVHHPLPKAGDEQQPQQQQPLPPPQLPPPPPVSHQQAAAVAQSPLAPATPVPTSATAVTGPNLQQQQQQMPPHAMLLPHQLPYNAPHPFMPGVSGPGPTGQFLPMVSQAALVSKASGIPGFFPANFPIPVYSQVGGNHPPPPPPQMVQAAQQQRMRGPGGPVTAPPPTAAPPSQQPVAVNAQYMQQIQYNYYLQQIQQMQQLQAAGQQLPPGIQNLALAQNLMTQQVMQQMQAPPPPPPASSQAPQQQQSPPMQQPPPPLHEVASWMNSLPPQQMPPQQLPPQQLPPQQLPPVVPPPQAPLHPADVTSPPPPPVQQQQPQEPQDKDHVVLGMEEEEQKIAVEEVEQEIVEQQQQQQQPVVEEEPEPEMEESKDDSGIESQVADKLAIAATPEVEQLPAAEEEPVAPVEPEAPPAAPVTPEPAVPKSWASLFKREGAGAGDVAAAQVADPNRKPMAMIQPYNPKASPKAAAGADKDGDVVTTRDMELADMLKSYQLNHRASVIKPRGLSNRSNWCFVNAILQALLACPPFYNLMKSVPKELLEENQQGASMKILAAVHSFFAEFAPMENFPKLNNRRRKNGGLPQGQILEPASIYNYLLNSLSPTDTFKVIEGRQEDAEEFLTFLLNGLNDEILALFKSVDKGQGQAQAEASDIDPDEEDEWQEVGPKNKSVVTRRGAQGNIKAKPPLAEIFQGQMRSCLQPVNGEPTATLQPFFSLQLDIQSGDVKSVTEALVNNFATEMIDGYVCPKTKQAVEASKSMTLEELPPILVLHLKRFVYDGSGKGSQKLLKNIDFPVDLEISSKILSSATKGKYLPVKQRQYKLFAVVYHNGTEATKGHYVTDIYHTGLATWIRCDDSILKIMTESMVLAHSANSLPYILFYRRGDTMTSSAVAGAQASAKQ